MSNKHFILQQIHHQKKKKKKHPLQTCIKLLHRQFAWKNNVNLIYFFFLHYKYNFHSQIIKG